MVGAEEFTEFCVQIAETRPIAHAPRVNPLVDLAAAKARLAAIDGEPFQFGASHAEKIVLSRQSRRHGIHFNDRSTHWKRAEGNLRIHHFKLGGACYGIIFFKK